MAGVPSDRWTTRSEWGRCPERLAGESPYESFPDFANPVREGLVLA